MRVFVTDCEGPISKNDNAFELASYYIPRGDRFFTIVSRYDDVLADIVRRPGYKAGDTLRLILPFLRAYGASDKGMRRYSRENILLVPGAAETLRFVSETMPSFIVSTSYEHYISALCEVVGFPFENTYCTRLEIDRYKLGGDQIERLKEIAREIAEMPMIEVPDGAESLDELSERDKETIKRLDRVFWNEIPRMGSGRMLREVNPVGGYEKANAVKDIASKTEVDFSEIIYIGDSITDVEPFKLIRERGGLTVSFNGNAYAIREAEIAVLSHHTVVTSILAEAFNKLGKEGAIRLVEDWNLPSLRRVCNPNLIDRLERLYHEKPPRVELITSANRERLMRESSAFRKTVRGEAIGRLG